jgi:neutral trehalase
MMLFSALLFSAILFSAPATFAVEKPDFQQRDAELEAQIPPKWRPAFEAVYETLDENLKAPDSKNPFWHVHPSPKYQAVYLWDSAFISQIWLRRDRRIAKDVIRSVLHLQLPDGRIPHMVSIFETSDLTQPPVLSWAAARIANESSDSLFATKVYSGLRSYHRWLYRNRHLKNGMFFWKHPYESGIDNSPRFGARDESYYIDTTSMAAIDISSYMVVDSESLVSLVDLILKRTDISEARRAKLTADRAVYVKQGEDLRTLVQTTLWDEKTGYFYDRFSKDGKFLNIPTIASFFPLFAGIATHDQAVRLMEHLRNPREFNTLIPLVTVARNSKKFEKDCWRGPIWINTAYMVIQGLKRYDQPELAKYFSRKLVEGVYGTWENTGKFVEFYDPDRYDFKELTRKKGTGPFGLSASSDPIEVIMHLVAKQWFLGPKPVDHFVGWTGLVNNLALDEVN